MPCGHPTRKIKKKECAWLGQTHTASEARGPEALKSRAVNRSTSVGSEGPGPGAQPAAHLGLSLFPTLTNTAHALGPVPALRGEQ